MPRLLVWTLKDVRDVIEKCVGNKFDFICFIEGNRGLGKSTLAYKLLVPLKVPKPFAPKRDIVYTREETLKHLATKKGGIIFSDEMINVAYNRDFFQEEQKTMLKALNMYRDSCNVFIGCIPKFVELDKQIQRLCKMRITVVRRGIALIQTQMPSIYSQDNWDIKNNQRIEAKWTARGGRNPQYAKLTTIRGIVHFSDLTPLQRQEYEAIKEEKRGRVFGEYQDLTLLGNPEKIFYDNLLTQLIAGKINNDLLDTIATINGKDKTKIRQKLNALLKEKGDTNRVRDYTMDKDKKQRRDKLGFVIKSSEQAFESKGIVPKRLQDDDEELMQEPAVEQSHIATPLRKQANDNAETIPPKVSHQLHTGEDIDEDDTAQNDDSNDGYDEDDKDILGFSQ